MKSKVFCQNIFDEVLPAVRAIIANRLTNTYGLTQSEVSEKLGLTQPAVSQYNNGLRGKKVKHIMSNKKILEYVDQLASQIANGNDVLNSKVCEICTNSRKEGVFSKEELNPFVCLLELAGVKPVG